MSPEQEGNKQVRKSTYTDKLFFQVAGLESISAVMLRFVSTEKNLVNFLVQPINWLFGVDYGLLTVLTVESMVKWI